MNAPLNHRGLRAVYANASTRSRGGLPQNASPQEVVAGLNTAFEEFKADHNSRIDRLENVFDDQAARIAAMQTGGGSGPIRGSARAALTNLGQFGRSGDPGALSQGLQPQAALSVGSDPDGGYTVPEEMADTITELQRDVSPMRRLARVITTRSASFDMPVNLGGTGTGWVGETAARPETTTPTFANVNIPHGEIYANPAITQQLLDDSAYALGEFIAEEIARTFAEQEGAAFIAGNGTNKPLGFLTGTPVATDDSARAFGTLQYIAGGAASTFSDDEKLVDLVFSLKSGYRQNGAWLMNSATLAVVSKFKDGNGRFLWQDSLESGTPGRLLGYPVEVDEDMPDIAADAFPIAFGDFRRGYVITDRAGVRLLRDPFTQKPYIMFYATKRVGGKLVDTNAIKLLKVATA